MCVRLDFSDKGYFCFKIFGFFFSSVRHAVSTAYLSAFFPNLHVSTVGLHNSFLECLNSSNAIGDALLE